ncbi:MAG: hypothetical protein JWQ43_1623 [Glaciihabitans sp.]|nr:hypothetical protein [Glaciihabitans sp.]
MSIRRAPSRPPRLVGGARVAGAAMVLLLLAGCASGPAAESAADPSTGFTGTPTDGDIAAFPVGGAFDYQLGGGYTPPEGVTVLARDSTESPADGAYSICYVNGFQSQPQDADFWLDEHPDLLLQGDDGKPVSDPNWPDEMMFDTSTGEQREAIAAIVGETISLCAEKSFDAIEFDNLDSYSRSHGALTVDDNLAMATLLVAASHERDLAVGQKNSVELGTSGRDAAGFDFAVAEECAQFDECAAYSDVYGNAVVDIEYSDALNDPFEDVCADADTPLMTVLRDRDLVTPDSADYVYESCPGRS